MDTITDSKYERYLVYPNESIDKLTVNRTFERLFEDIDAKTKNSSLRISSATDKSYGMARFSPSAEYLFDKPSEADGDYDGAMLNIAQLRNMSKRISDTSHDSLYVAPSVEGVPLESNRYWVRSDYMDSKFVFMPNGVNIVTCSFNIGFNGLTDTLSSNVSKEDIVSPVILDSYRNDIDIDTESQWNITDFINDNSGMDGHVDASDVSNLVNLDGRYADIPFMEPVQVRLRHNRCTSTRFSAYEQSYVEISMTMSLSVKSLFVSKYMNRRYETIGADSSVSESEDVNEEMSRKFRLFTQKPMAMAQIVFFNNESNPSLTFGFDNRIEDSVKYLVAGTTGSLVAVKEGDVVSIGEDMYSISIGPYVQPQAVDEDDHRRRVEVEYNPYSGPSVTPVAEYENMESAPETAIEEEVESSFSSHSRLSQKPLDEVEVDGEMVSPVNGSVIVKKVENRYDRVGNIVDNIVHLDIIMKFMAGSASDPEMEYALNNLNSRSRVQVALIGV